MRTSDAPAPGWYPDPEHRSRLRWWDGLDWTDIRRAPPSDAELTAAVDLSTFAEPEPAAVPQRQFEGLTNRQNDPARMMEEFRTVARQEVDRAAQQFSDRATTAVRSVGPLISEYGTQVKSWVRRAVIISIFLLVVYFVIQVVGQAALLDWLGDRIDGFTEDSTDHIGVRPRSGRFLLG